MEAFIKLQCETPDLNQDWAVVAYALNKDKISDQVGYFIFLKAFPSRSLAEIYTKEIVERTGVNSIAAVKACKFLPLAKTLDKVIPVNVNSEGNLIKIANDIENQDKIDKESKAELDRLKDIDKAESQDLNSIQSIAYNWYLYVKYRSQQELYQQKLDHAVKIVNDNIDKILEHKGKFEDVFSYLKDRLTRSGELPLLTVIHDEISNLINQH